MAQSGKLNVSYVVLLKKADLRIFLSQSYLMVAGWEGAASQRGYLQLIQLARLNIERCVWTWRGSDSPLDLCCIQGIQGHPTTSVAEKRKQRLNISENHMKMWKQEQTYLLIYTKII